VVSVTRARSGGTQHCKLHGTKLLQFSERITAREGAYITLKETAADDGASRETRSPARDSPMGVGTVMHRCDRPIQTIHSWRPMIFIRGSLLLTFLSVHSGAVDAAGAADPRKSCEALHTLTISAAAIGLPSRGATISESTLVAANASSNPYGEYCRVRGSIAPVDARAPALGFAVNLPTAWNLKSLQFGGAGYDGLLVTGLGPVSMQSPDIAAPLQQGYVTLGSDGGHQGGLGFDGRFGLNDEALLNYGQQSVKKTHDVAIAIVKSRYGRFPKRSYFIGGSQGGHEALDAAARYPADYDGVVANFPAYDLTMLHLGSLNVGRAVYGNGGAAWLNAQKVKLVTDAVYTACDGLDGVRDGIISNLRECNRAFNIETLRTTLRCPNGIDAGDACLSDAQIGAVKQITSPYSAGYSVQGLESFPPWPLLEGALFSGPSNLGASAIPSNPPRESDALLYAVGAATVKYFISRDESFDALQFDEVQWQGRVEQLAKIADVTSVNLTPFRRRGGKMILTHGMIDDLITPHNTEAYYEHHRALQGGHAMHEFVRFYLIPGFGHGFGVFNATFDPLGTLDAWVDEGVAPETLIAVDANPGAKRSRPMCVYPAWPKFTQIGGSPNASSSFSCVK
jgi:pimeloyl-ACP methyl ester carboxylesterase